MSLFIYKTLVAAHSSRNFFFFSPRVVIFTVLTFFFKNDYEMGVFKPKKKQNITKYFIRQKILLK